MSFNLYAQKTSQLPQATGTGKGSLVNIVQNGANKKISSDSLIKPALNYADSLKGVINAALAIKTSFTNIRDSLELIRTKRFNDSIAFIANIATKLSTNDTTNKWLPQGIYIPAQFNPIAGTNISLSGLYPNITINSGGAGGSTSLQAVTDNGSSTTNTIQFKKNKSVIGKILTDNFTGGGFGSTDYDSTFTSTTRVCNSSYLTVDNGNGQFSNNILYKKYTGRNKYSQSVKFLALNKTASSYGVAIGTQGINSFFKAGITVQFSVDNGGTSGKIIYWDNANVGGLLQISTTALSFNIGDTLIGSYTREDNSFVATFYNKTQNTSITSSYVISTATVNAILSGIIPGTGKFGLYFMGGNQQVYNWTVESNETKNNVVFVNNSITVGYTASTLANRYVSKIFPSRYSYEISGGSGDRSEEAVNKLDELKSLTPQYVIYSIGVNDAQSGVTVSQYSANTRKIFDTLIANNIIPIALSCSPNNTYSTALYNDSLSAIALRYGIKYINTYDSLRNGTAWKTNYTADNIHPNDSGHLVIARIIKRAVPYILGDTAIRFNRLVYNPDLRYFLGVNEKTGSVELSSNFITNSSTYDAPSIATMGTTTTTTIAVTGAVLGNYAHVAFGISLQGIVATAYVSAANVVTIVLFNPTGAAIDLASTTVKVKAE